MANELGRLANGVGTRMTSGTQTINFITKQQIPLGRKVTYARIVCDIKPQKSETHHTRLTVGGNLIDYPWDLSTPTCNITTAKILFNSVICPFLLNPFKNSIELPLKTQASPYNNTYPHK